MKSFEDCYKEVKKIMDEMIIEGWYYCPTRKKLTHDKYDIPAIIIDSLSPLHKSVAAN